KRCEGASHSENSSCEIRRPTQIRRRSRTLRKRRVLASRSRCKKEPLFHWCASSSIPRHETTALGCGALYTLYNKLHRAIANSGAISRTTSCGLRPALGRRDSNARQSRTERDAVFAKDSRWLAAEDACNLYTNAVHLGHLPCPRRLLRLAWLHVCA